METKTKDFFCETCNYKSTRKSDFNSHMLSKRHLNKFKSNDEKLSCETCKKVFKTQSGLWKHTTKCIVMKKEEKNDNKIVFLNKYCKTPREIKNVFEQIHIDDNYFTNFNELEYVNVVQQMFQTAFKNIPILERPIYCFTNENDDIDIYYVYHNKKWIKETELQFMKQILYESIDEYPEEKKTILLEVIQLFNDNILRDIKKYKNVIFERDNNAEIEFIPTRIIILKGLIHATRVNKSDFC
jgi:hypothetical protein